MAEQSTMDQQPEKPIIDDKLKENVRSRNTWLRFLYMVVYVFVLGLAEIVLAAVVVVQFFTVLLTGERNDKLLDFGRDVSLFVYDLWLYLCFATETRPFPFGEWRSATASRSDA